MSIVTISRGSYSRGKEVAEKVALKLGFECISRDVLIEASKEFDVPEARLLSAIRDAPSIFDRFTFGKERYVAYVQAALLHHFQKDNVVYHGLAGHYFVQGVSHVLKVRIIADREPRVKVVMEREGVSRDKAMRLLANIDEGRRKWGLRLYDIDTRDPSLYDLVIHIDGLSTDDAAEMICFAARLAHLQATDESQQALDDLLLSARVNASLIERYPRVNVTASQGVVRIGVEGASAAGEKAIRDIAGGVPGAKQIEVNSYPFLTPDWGG